MQLINLTVKGPPNPGRDSQGLLNKNFSRKTLPQWGMLGYDWCLADEFHLLEKANDLEDSRIVLWLTPFSTHQNRFCRHSIKDFPQWETKNNFFFRFFLSATRTMKALVFLTSARVTLNTKLPLLTKLHLHWMKCTWSAYSNQYYIEQARMYSEITSELIC